MNRLTKTMKAGMARAICAALLFVFPAVSVAQTAPPQGATPALWRVHNGTSTVYLFGSLHILPAGYPWMTPEIQTAMGASDLFVFEVPVDDAALKDEKDFIVQYGLLPARQNLKSVLNAYEYQTYSSVLKRAGLKPEQFERYRPWLAAVVLGLAYLHRDDLGGLKGADDELMAYARDHGRKFIYFESMRQQMELLTTGDDITQLRAFKGLIAGLSRSRNQQQELLDTWASGDAKKFTGLLAGYFRGRHESQELLIDGRNRNWMSDIQQFLARPNGTTMITVGAAHLGGRNGLISLLCGQGYGVERVGAGGASGENVCGPES
jgi:hypothetical protein